jgi:hypothetical protein
MDGCNWSLTSLASILERLGICGKVSGRTLGRELTRRGIDWSEIKLDMALRTSYPVVTMDASDEESRQEVVLPRIYGHLT